MKRKVQLIRPSTLRVDLENFCQHEWRQYKKTYNAENGKFLIRNRKAWFTVRACDKCKRVEYLNYQIDR